MVETFTQQVESTETQVGFDKLATAIERVNKTGKTEDVRISVAQEAGIVSTTIRFVKDNDEIKIGVKLPWGGVAECKPDNLKETLIEQFEVSESEINNIEVEVKKPIAEAVIAALQVHNEQLQRENVELRAKVASMEVIRTENEELRRQLVILNSQLAAAGIEEDDDISPERMLPDGMTIDGIGVMRQKWFSRWYEREIAKVPSHDFTGITGQTLEKLTQAFGYDEDRGWNGKPRSTDLTEADWRKRLPKGIEVKQIVRQSLKGIIPRTASGEVDYRADKMVSTLNLLIDLDVRKQELKGLGPALAETRRIAGEFLNMNRTKPSDFFAVISESAQQGGLGIGRINFTVTATVSGDKQEIIRLSLPTQTKSDLRQLYKS